MKKLSGFSLMEMMVVLLIVSIIAAAAAPMVNRKIVATASEKSPWVRTGTNNNITFNLQNDERTASIGIMDPPTNHKARLYLTTKELDSKKYIPQLALGDGSNVTPMKIISAKNNIWISTKDTNFKNTSNRDITNSVVIGNNTSTSGTSSTAIGYNTSASYRDSVAIGNNTKVTSGTGISIGNNTTASNHDVIAIGDGINSSMTRTVAIGFDIELNDSAEHSIAIGNKASVSKGAYAIAIGEGASTTGSSSIAIGNNTTAIGNTKFNQASIAIGRDSKAIAQDSIAIGRAAAASGSSSIAIGVAAANDDNTNPVIASGAYSIAIGKSAIAESMCSVAIGYHATANKDNQIVLGDKSATVYIPGNLVVDGNVLLGGTKGSGLYMRETLTPSYLWHFKNEEKDYMVIKRRENVTIGGMTYSSDRRMKNVGKAFVGGLEEIKKLEVFNYTFKADKSKTPRVGVMAQDLQKIFPDAVIKGEDGFLRIRMEDMFYALVNAVKELAYKFEIHDKKIEELTKQNIELQKTIDNLEKRIEKLETDIAR